MNGRAARGPAIPAPEVCDVDAFPAVPARRPDSSSSGFFSSSGACGGGAPPEYTAEELEAAKAQLRDHARLRTFEAGRLFGDEWVARAPHDAELRGLYAYQLVGWRLSKEVHEQADAILADDPGSPWGLYAKAYRALRR